MKHELKTADLYFDAVLSGLKTFEIRKDDRGYCVGDTLHLREVNDRYEHTGRELSCLVSYIFKESKYHQLTKKGYCTMAIVDPELNRSGSEQPSNPPESYRKGARPKVAQMVSCGARAWKEIPVNSCVFNENSPDCLRCYMGRSGKL